MKIIGSLRAVPDLKASSGYFTAQKYASAKRASPMCTNQTTHFHAWKLMEDRKPKGRSGLIARSVVSLSLLQPRHQQLSDSGNSPPPHTRRRLQACPASLPRHLPLRRNQHPALLHLERSLHAILLQLCATEQR